MRPPPRAARSGRVAADQQALQTLLAQLDLLTLTLDRTGRVLTCTAALVPLTGWAVADLGRCNWFTTLLSPDNGRAALATFQAAVESGTPPAATVLPIIQPNGALRQLRWHTSFVYDATGRVLHSVHLAQAVSSPAAATVAPDAADLPFQAIFDHARDTILLTDDTGHYIAANPAAATLFGMPVGDLVGQHISDITDSALLPVGEQRWQQFVAQDLQSGEFRIRRADGLLRTVEFNAQAHIRPGIHLAILRDITARKEAEDALRHSEARFSAVFYANPTAIALLRRNDGVYVDVNPSWERLFGRARRTVLGQSALDVHQWLSPVDQAAVVTSATLGRASGWTNVQVRVRRPDGTLREVRSTGQYVQVNGEACILSSSHDITADQQAAETLRQSEERFATTFRSSPSALSLSRVSDGQVLDVNASWEHLFGWSRAEAVRCSWREMDLYVDPLEAEGLLQHLRARQPLREVPLTIRGRTGDIREISLSLDYIQSAGEWCVLGTSRDVTAHNWTLRALQESEEHFRRCFEDAAIGMALVALTGESLRVNTALCAMLGYSAAALGALTFQAVTHPDDVAADLALVERVLSGAIDSYRMEKRYVHHDGHILWAHLNVTLLRDDIGRPLQLLAQIEDVTERRQAEEAVRRAGERLQLLHELALATRTVQPLEVIGQTALGFVRRLVPCPWVAILLFAPATNSATLLAVAMDGQTAAGDATAVALSALGSIAQGGEGPVWTATDTAAWHALLGIMPNLPLAAQPAISVPINTHGTPIGCLTLGTGPGTTLTTEALAIAGEVAAQLALALHDAQLFAALHAGRSRLQQLSQRLLEVQEEERRHLARELHDEFGQLLTVLVLQLQTGQTQTDLAALQQTLSDSTAVVAGLLGHVRSLALDLRPAMLDDLGLGQTLRWYLDQQLRPAGLAAQLRVSGLTTRLPPAVETVCFRVAQEALTNIIRHAHAQHVTVTLDAAGDEVQLAICDDGVGFDVERARAAAGTGHSMGLLSMHERVELAGGTLRIDAPPGGGICVQVRIPVQARPLERRAAERRWPR